MRKYEELKNNLYVKEVGKLTTLVEASKMLGVSNKELKTFVVKEQMKNNSVIKDMLDKLFGMGIVPDVQQEYFLDLLEGVNDLEYKVSVLDYNFPTLKANPKLLLQAIIEYGDEQIKKLDVIEVPNGDVVKNPALLLYVSEFSSEYGISSRRMFNFINEAQKKNSNIFNQILGNYRKRNYDSTFDNETLLNDLKKVSNLDYVIASIIYNFPNMTKDTDTFFEAILNSKGNNIENIDTSEIEDESI